MKYTPIVILYVLSILCATGIANDICAKEFKQDFDDLIVYFKNLLNTCERLSRAKQRKAEAVFQQNYGILTSSTYQNCHTLRQCNRLKKEEEALACLLNQTWQNTQLFRNVSHEAYQYSLALDKEIHLINVEEYRCTNETVHQMGVETLEAIDELTKCTEALIVKSRTQSFIEEI